MMNLKVEDELVLPGSHTKYWQRLVLRSQRVPSGLASLKAPPEFDGDVEQVDDKKKVESFSGAVSYEPAKWSGQVYREAFTSSHVWLSRQPEDWLRWRLSEGELRRRARAAFRLAKYTYVAKGSE